MSHVDYEKAWFDLKSEIAKKPSHGQGGLFEVMGRIEVKNRVSEANRARYLRWFEDEIRETLARSPLIEHLIGNSPNGPDHHPVTGADGEAPDRRTPPAKGLSEENQHDDHQHAASLAA